MGCQQIGQVTWACSTHDDGPDIGEVEYRGFMILAFREGSGYRAVGRPEDCELPAGLQLHKDLLSERFCDRGAKKKAIADLMWKIDDVLNTYLNEPMPALPGKLKIFTS